MFSSDEDIPETEKIDRIYKMLRANRRERLFGLVVKLVLLWGLVYGYYYLNMPTHADVRVKLSDAAQEKITEFTMPIVGSMVQQMTNNIREPIQVPASGKRKNNVPANITPEMIKAVQDAMKK